MRHFLFEFITGGGLSGVPLSESLIGEGELMLQTLLKELSELEGMTISLCRDSRLPLNENNIEQTVIKENLDEMLTDLIKNSDVNWLIAPESDGYMEKYARLFIKHGNMFIGSSSDAIKLTASKHLTNKVLFDNGIKVVETEWLNQKLPKSKASWVIKPDDGAGAEDTCLVVNEDELNKFIRNVSSKNLIVQPYIEGKPMSMSLLVFNGDVRLIACNEQFIEITEGQFKLKGIGVNECLSYKTDMLQLAKRIVSAIPGLAGYVGVDLIELNKELYVLEVNPRLTTAYVGISESISSNVASMILDTFLNKKLPDIELDSAIPVRINI